MYSPAVCSIAEIGIGVNLAFSLVQDFREWVHGLIRKSAGTTALKLKASLAEAENGYFVADIECIVNDEKMFDGAYRLFVTAAMVASALLMALLWWAAYNFTGDENATGWPTIPTAAVALSVGPRHTNGGSGRCVC